MYRVNARTRSSALSSVFHFRENGDNQLSGIGRRFLDRGVEGEEDDVDEGVDGADLLLPDVGVEVLNTGLSTISIWVKLTIV